MKKQVSLSGKRLTRNAMMHIQGGVSVNKLVCVGVCTFVIRCLSGCICHPYVGSPGLGYCSNF